MSDASTPNFSFNHLILFSRYSCAWGNLPGTIRALRTKVTAIGTSSHVVLSTQQHIHCVVGSALTHVKEHLNEVSYPQLAKLRPIPVSDAILLHVMWP